MRARVTVTAVLVLGLALVAGALVLVALLGTVLTDQVCRSAQDRADQLAATVTTTTVPPSTGTELVQLIDRGGQVVGSGRRLASPGAGCVSVEPPGHGEDFAFAAARLEPGGEVIVGLPLVDVLDSTRFVRRVLVVGVPLMMLIVGAVTWVVTGRVLAPVTAIRREADEITASELHRRVPAVRQDEIGRLARTMNRMLDRLQRSQESQHCFVSDASHELRSPIAAIRQHAEVARAHPDRTSVDELAMTVQAEAVRMQRLVDDLLLLARADEARAAPPETPIDLDDLVFAEAEWLRSATDLTVGTATVSAGQVRADEAALGRMIHNLADNAARHARTEITFSLHEDGGCVVLRVSDDGLGIPPEDRARVFQRFVRLDSARSRESGGSGLGLAIVADIVARHRGTIRILDDSTFEARLPGTGCVAEDEPAECAVHVDAFAAAGDDAGQVVLKADGPEARAETEDPDQVVDDDNDGVDRELPPDGSVGTEVEGPVERVRQPERTAVGDRDRQPERGPEAGAQGGQ